MARHTRAAAGELSGTADPHARSVSGGLSEGTPEGRSAAEGKMRAMMLTDFLKTYPQFDENVGVREAWIWGGVWW